MSFKTGFHRAALCVVLLLALAGSALAQVRVTIGSTPVTLAVPPGFVNVTDPQLRSLAERFVPARNRLLAVYVPPQVHRDWASGRPTEFPRYFMVQTLRSAETMTVSQALFDDLRKILRRDIESIVKRSMPQASAEISKNLSDAELRADISNVNEGQVFADTAEEFSYFVTSDVRLDSTAGDSSIKFKQGSGMSAFVLRGKLVFVYTYGEVRTAADRDWVKSEAVSLAARMRLANR